jgi:transposase
LVVLNQVSCVPLQQGLRHLQTAFSNFFAGRAVEDLAVKNHDRDINAAHNILAAGLAVKICGANVRPDRHKSDGSCDEAESSKK